MCSSLGPTSLGLPELPGLPGSLFPLPDWGSFPSLFLQITFNFLLLFFSFWHPYNSDIGMFQVVPEVCKSLFTFLNSCFFILFQLDVYFSFFLIFIVIQLQLSAFSPHPSTPPQLNPPPSPTSTLSLGFVHMSFIVVPVILSPHCPLPTPPWLLLDCS